MTDAALGPTARKHYETAVLLHRQGRLEDARRQYQEALRDHPAHPVILQALGVVHIHLGDVAKAADFFARAIAGAPRDATAHIYLGMALARLGRTRDAIGAFETALTLQPGRPDILAHLGDARLRSGQYEAAAEAFRSALAKDPHLVPALMGLGDALGIMGRHADAKQAFERVLAIQPNFAPAHFGIGNQMMHTGQIDEARRAFEKAVALSPGTPALHRALAETATFTEDDARLTALLALADKERGLPPDQKVELHFALAKAFDDLKRYQQAFTHLQAGNAIRRNLVAYDEAGELRKFEQIKAAFAEPVHRDSAAGCDSDLPIFIIGMPRSGTSLVEQMLASLPGVFGAGELTAIPDLLAERRAGEAYPSGVTLLPRQYLSQFGEDYVTRVRQLRPDAKRIIDKLPTNFFHVGLIRRALPNAHIVHVHRDPRDTCFSCYSKLFLNGLDFTYDLGELGRYYRAYEKLMAHWRRILPAGSFLDVEYEALVADAASEARRIVEFCGLDWDDRCLRFHETDRAVRTLSAQQVRKPLSATSIGRWRPYAQWLQPLFDALH